MLIRWTTQTCECITWSEQVTNDQIFTWYAKQNLKIKKKHSILVVITSIKQDVKCTRTVQIQPNCAPHKYIALLSPMLNKWKVHYRYIIIRYILLSQFHLSFRLPCWCCFIYSMIIHLSSLVNHFQLVKFFTNFIWNWQQIM